MRYERVPTANVAKHKTFNSEDHSTPPLTDEVTLRSDGDRVPVEGHIGRPVAVALVVLAGQHYVPARRRT